MWGDNIESAIKNLHRQNAATLFAVNVAAPRGQVARFLPVVIMSKKC